MNHSDDCPDYDDTLGRMLRWSLRSDAGRRGPSPAVWPQIESRMQAWELRSSRRDAAHRQRQRVRAAFAPAGSMLVRAGGLAFAAIEALFSLCALVWRFVDERTVSSEAVWLADTHTAPRNMHVLRCHLTLQVVSAGPLLGQRLPII